MASRDQVNSAIHWFRRDLRLEDNRALAAALKSGLRVQPIFIFDENILSRLERDDRRITFIAEQLTRLNQQLQKHGGSLRILQGRPVDVFRHLVTEMEIAAVYCNEDYEPYARQRDAQVAELCQQAGIGFFAVKDHVIFSPAEILKDDGSPYQVFTPYSRRWLANFELLPPTVADELRRGQFVAADVAGDTTPESLGFVRYGGAYPPADFPLSVIEHYDTTRDWPALTGTSRLGVHLRFGTVSIRKLALAAYELNRKYLGELIWREFYQMILWHFPHTVEKPFKAIYKDMVYPGTETDFQKWCRAETGYPLVDAGVRELIETGFMHNRVRMVAASFLTKHLLCDWRWGERFFARHLYDFELASNVGGWQWCAGVGADAAPYFRIFNPAEQQKKFDPKGEYVARWSGNDVNFFGTPVLEPMIDHRFARERCLKFFSAVRQ